MSEGTKTCTRCGEEKPMSAFYRKKGRARGDSVCKACRSEISAKRYLENREAIKARTSAYAKANPDVGRRKSRKYRDTNLERARQLERERVARDPERKRQQNAASYQRHKSEVNERSTARRIANPERAREYNRRWRESHPPKPLTPEQKDRLRDYQRQWAANRRDADPQFRLQSAIRAAIWRTLQPSGRGAGRTFALLGYSRDSLVSHLDALLLPGMTWENYGEWHVDHIRPLASFKYETPNDPAFKEAWALTNLQPLWGPDNMSKGAKWQPDREAANDNAASDVNVGRG